jgi:REP-associated tyrosine transposase
MARPLRIEFENATYHVTSRGNRREAIVYEEHDRWRWREWLERVVEQCQWQVLAYCLLDNHFHLFVRTPLANLSAGMLVLNGSYTSYFNRRHHLVGHLFQGRYKAVLVEDGHHFDAISRYIHLNPVRAGLSQRPEDWTWSSCAGYYRASRAESWTTQEPVLAGFGGATSVGRRAYRRFVEAGLTERPPSPLAEAVNGLLLGSEAWAESIRALLRESEAPRQTPAYRDVVRVPLDRIAAEVAAYYEVPASYFGRRHGSHIARGVFAHLARGLGQATLGELAAWLGLKCPQSVHSLLRRHEQTLSRSPRLADDIAELRTRIQKQKTEP